jgi:hypothetical protein
MSRREGRESMSTRKVLLTDPEGQEAKAALRAIQEKINSINFNVDRSVALVERLQAKLGQP